MASEGMLEYASTRVQAQHGRLPTEADWRALEATRDLGQYLETARSTGLASWVSSFDPGQDLHAIERSLRNQWEEHVKRVASWHPRQMQPWLAWLAWLPALALLARLARDVPAPGWLLADPLCGPVAAGSPAERAAALHSTALARLAPAVSGDGAVAALWLDHWEQLTKPMDPAARRLKDQLLESLRRHTEELKSGDSAQVLRRNLAMRIEVLFRRSQRTVVGAACHLGRLALELERLRGGLASRHVQVVQGEPG